MIRGCSVVKTFLNLKNERRRKRTKKSLFCEEKVKRKCFRFLQCRLSRDGAIYQSFFQNQEEIGETFDRRTTEKKSKGTREGKREKIGRRNGK